MILRRDTDIVNVHIVIDFELVKLIAFLTVTDRTGSLAAPRYNDTAVDLNRVAFAAVADIGIEKV